MPSIKTNLILNFERANRKDTIFNTDTVADSITPNELPKDTSQILQVTSEDMFVKTDIDGHHCSLTD